MSISEFQELRHAAKEAAQGFTLPRDWQDGRVEAHGFTVDSESTLDRDDAILITPETDGTTQVDVTLADTSFIPPDSPIATYALALGETQYHSKGNISMLPRGLGEGALSLLDGVVRPSVTVSMILNRDGTLGETAVAKSFINPTRMTYGNVADMTHGRHPDEAQVALWRQYEAFAVNLLKGRRDSGALAFFNADRHVLTDEEGKPVFLGEGTEHSGQVIVQELMILTNCVLAEYAERHDIPAIYRRHEWASDVDIRRITQLIEQGGRDRIGQLLENKGRGFYSPTPGRHDALNVDRYGRFTSPLRRGVDFIGIGNVVAHLDGSPYPYPANALAGWSERLTERERTPYLKQVAKAKANNVAEKRLEAEVEQLITLPAAEFNRVIKIACESDSLPPALTEAVTQLATRGELPQGHLNRLLVRRTANEDWLTLRAQLMSYVVGRSGLAKAILLEARVGQTLENLAFEPATPSAEGFSATVTANYPDGPFVEKTGSASTKKVAENSAALEVLAQLAGVQLEAIEEPADPNALRSPISLLNEFYQRTGGHAAFDTDLMEGSTPHAPVFECKLTISGREEPFIGIGKNKKEAETNAAAKAIAAENIAERMAQLANSTKEVAVDPSKNPRSLLNELAQSRRWPQPVYDTQRTSGHEHAPNFTSTLTVKGAADEGETEDPRFIGQGPKAKIAENNAARRAVETLAPWMVREQ